MRTLFESVLITAVVFIINSVFSEKKRNPIIYLVIFLVIAGINFFFNKAHASEFEYPIDYFPNAKMEIVAFQSYTLMQRNLSPEDRKFYEEKVRFHRSNGERTYNDAKNKCWYLPDLSDREKAKYCFTTAVSVVGASSPVSQIVAATTTLLLQYGLDCLDEWAYIQNKLHWSEYHFEMMEFYQEVLRQG